MCRVIMLLLSALLVAAAVGCGGEKDTPINRDKDRPKAAGKD